jgi:hypothetical protein
MNSTYGRLNTTAKEYEQALIGRVKESGNSEKIEKSEHGNNHQILHQPATFLVELY